MASPNLSILITVTCEILFITSCLYAIQKTLKYKPKNYHAFIILYGSLASASVVGIIKFAHLNAYIASYHQRMSEIVGLYIMSMMLPLGVFQSLDCFPISLSKQVGNYIIWVMISLIALLSWNRGFLLINFGINDETIVMIGMSISIVLALYGWFISNRSSAIYKSKNLIYCIIAMSIADMILTKQLLDSVNTTPLSNIDLFHIAFSVGIYFLSNVSSGYSL